MQNNTALLVIDVQIGMFEGPEGPVHDAERLLERIGALIREARQSRVPVIYIQHCEGPGELFEPDTHEWRIHSAIAPREGELVVEKRTPDSFHETTLRRELDSRGVNRLILTGMQTEFCVDTTCRKAFSLGYDVVLVKDAHGTWDTDDLSATQDHSPPQRRARRLVRRRRREGCCCIRRLHRNTTRQVSEDLRNVIEFGENGLVAGSGAGRRRTAKCLPSPTRTTRPSRRRSRAGRLTTTPDPAPSCGARALRVATPRG